MSRSHRWFFLMLLGGCAFDEPPEVGEPVASAQQNFYYDANHVWPKRPLSVCFINEAGSAEASWARAAVEAAWESVADVDFVGWGACKFIPTLNGVFTNGGYLEDIRIHVGEGNLPKSDIGTKSRDDNSDSSMKMNFFRTTPRDLDGKSGDDFSFCYSNTAATSVTGKTYSSMRRYCIEVIAVHEFGHALGIVHEANRADSICTATQGSHGTTTLGPYDPLSIMNYCSPIFDNDGLLSSYDIAGAQEVYGRASNDYLWWMVGNVRDIAGATFDGLLFRNSAQNHEGQSRPFTGNFNGDTRGDVFWYQPGVGSDSISWGSPLHLGLIFPDGSQSVTGDYVPIVGDFDSNATDDIYWYAPGSGRDFIWFGQSSSAFDQTVTAQAFNRDATFVPLAGDFDADGRGDIFWYQAGSGQDYIWWGTDTRGSFTEVMTEVSGLYRPIVGDFDGDGATDIEWYGIGASADHTWFGSTTRNFGKSTDFRSVTGVYTPFVGDFDGNGCDDIFWNGSSSDDFVWLGAPGTTNPPSVRINIPDDDYIPLVADFDGNGMDDIYWYTE